MYQSQTSTKLDASLLDSPTKTRSKQIPANKKAVMKKLGCIFLLSMTFMIIEIIGGILSNSLAILADAGHLFSDLLGFLISIGSVWISGFAANRTHSYGFHRAGVIGALASVIIIWGLTGFLIYYAVQRVINIDKLELDGKVMFFTAIFGLLTNISMIYVLNWESELTDKNDEEVALKPSRQNSLKANSRRPKTYASSSGLKFKRAASLGLLEDYDRDEVYEDDLDSPPKEEDFNEGAAKFRMKIRSISQVADGTQEGIDLKDDNKHKVAGKIGKAKEKIKQDFNIRAAVIHIIGDMIQSIGVIIAAALIWINPVKLRIADPIITFVFSIIVLFTTARIVRDCIFVLMEAVPRSLNLDEFEEALQNVKGVVKIHELHVWSLSEEQPAMSAHVFTNEDAQIVLRRMTKVCRMYEIYHSTIQIETITSKEDNNVVSIAHHTH